MSRTIPYVFAAFIGPLLLFQIQPIAARVMLPVFGGGAVVWATTLVFFQLVVVAGYAYAHALSRLRSARTQAVVHISLACVSLLWLPIQIDATPGQSGPAIGVISALAGAIAVPALIAASSSPLTQHWYSRSRPASPYRLYAVSNAGSLLGLLTYPFAIEPTFGLRAQLHIWSGTYLALLLCFAACAWLSPKMASARKVALAAPAPRATSHVLWLALSGLGVALLLATTERMTANIAAFPFLWIVPLALYLTSFIICFAGPRPYQRRLWLGLFALSILPTLWLEFVAGRASLALVLGLDSLSLFAGCMVAHGELARSKPNSQYLTGFYLSTGIGGAIGGAFVAIAAPILFEEHWEHMVALWGIFVLAGFLVSRDSPRRASRRAILLSWCASAAVLVYLGALPLSAQRNEHLFTTRTPYGQLRVIEVADASGVRRELIHGDIVHGTQSRLPGPRLEPTTYYRPDGGIGDALRRRDGGALRIGVIGLGVGTIAAYGRDGDTLRFYELDPVVARMARDYFTYLSDSAADIEVVLGDARISLQREAARAPGPQFDVMILDAFNSGAVPTHLLTLEAFALYLQHLEPDGTLAVNIASSYVDLAAVVRGAARELRMRTAIVARGHAQWMLVARDEPHPPTIHDQQRESPRTVLWTDDYANIFDVTKWF